MAQGASIFDEIDQEEKAKTKPVSSPAATPAPTGNIFDQIHAEANPVSATAPVTATAPVYSKSPTPWRDAIEQGITDAGDALVKLPGQIYHAATDTTKPDELGTPMGPVGLAVKRLVVDPSVENIKDFLTKFKSDPTGLKPESHVALLKAIPILGPMFAPLGSALENGDYKGAAREASNLLTQGAVAEVGGEMAGKGSQAIEDAANTYTANARKLALHTADNPASFTPSAPSVGKAFLRSGAPRAQFDAVNRVFDAGAQDFKAASDQYLGKGATIDDALDMRRVGKNLAEDVYQNEILKPASQIGKTNLAPTAEQAIQQIPSHWTATEKSQAAATLRDILSGNLDGTELAAKLKQLNADNTAFRLANNYDKALADALPGGRVINIATDAIRDLLHDKVAAIDPYSDIKGSLQKYGNITDLTKRADVDIPMSPDLADILLRHNYVTGTGPNLYGRAVQAITEHWTSNDAYIKKAFDRYNGPVPKSMEPVANYPSPPALALPPAGEGPVSQTQGTNYMYARGAGPNALRDITSSSPLGETGFGATRVPPAPPQKLLGSTPLQPVEGEIITPEEWAARFQGKPMPEVTSSTRLDTKALYGGPAKALPAAPFKFTMPGQPPLEIKIGESAQPANRVLTSSSDLHGPMANTYPPNWQLDSTPAPNRSVTIDGRQVTTNAGGPGNLITTDPKVVESTVAQYDQLIKDAGKVKTTAGKTRMAELQSQRDNLVRQLIEYNKQRQAGAVR